MHEPLISVVIPTHNRADLLMRSLHSVLTQTWPRLEVIVVDDASTDGTAARVQAMNDARVRLAPLSEQHGAAGARNAGIRAASGEYIAFQDSDDLWHADKLAAQMAYMQETAADMVFCRFHRCEEDGTIRQTFPHDRIGGGVIRMQDLLFENLASTQTMLFRRDFLRSLMFDERFTALEDWDLALRAAEAGRVAYQPTPLADVTLRADSISHHQDRALAALRLIYARYGTEIRRDESVCRQWFAAYVHAGRGCGARPWRDCLALMGPEHGAWMNLQILLRTGKEFLMGMR